MATQKLSEEEIAVREVVDAVKEIIREGLADKHLVDIYNVVNNRATLVLKRGDGNGATAKVASATGETAKRATGKQSGTTTPAKPRATRRTKREKLFSVLRSARLKGVTVKVLGTSEKDPAKSLVEIVTGNDHYEPGKKVAVKSDNLTDVS